MSTISIETAILKDMVGTAIKGAGNDRLLPLTELMCLKADKSKGTLSIVTTDGTNYLYIYKDINSIDEDFYVVVRASQFAGLVSKLTKPTTTLSISANALEVKSNGTYRIDIPMEEDGNIVVYPDPYSELNKKITDGNIMSCSVKKNTIEKVVHACGASLAQTLEVPCYTGYYCGDRVIATDSEKIASIPTRLFTDNNILVPPTVFNLVTLTGASDITFTLVDNHTMVFESEGCIVIGEVMDGVDDYPVDAITGLVDNAMEGKCTVSKAELVSLLDRIALFVGTYDDHAIRLTFTKKGIDIESLQSSGIEHIDYKDEGDKLEGTYVIDITYLLSEVKSIQSDTITIGYGADNAIKLDDEEVTIVIALMEK